MTYKLWWQFCHNSKISPFQGAISDVISFLQIQLDRGKNLYGTFNSHRSALSLILPNNIGDNPLLKRFLKGIFRLRPNKPKYNSVWDPQQVLEFLSNSTRKDLEFISKKLITLLALVTGQRLQTLALIRINHIVESQSGLQIFIPDRIKTSRLNTSQPCLNVPYFQEKPNICVATTLKFYIELTANLRSPQNMFLFITIKKPHKKASKQSLSRWVKDTIKLAGVDTTIFKSHSTRHSSTSAALRKGLSLNDIQRTAGWSQNSATFAKFYNRPIFKPDSFANAVLKN